MSKPRESTGIVEREGTTSMKYWEVLKIRQGTIMIVLGTVLCVGAAIAVDCRSKSNRMYKLADRPCCVAMTMARKYDVEYAMW